MITRIVMVATLAAFVLLLARKWGGIEWMRSGVRGLYGVLR